MIDTEFAVGSPPRLDEAEVQFGTAVFRRRRFVERVLGACTAALNAPPLLNV